MIPSDEREEAAIRQMWAVCLACCGHVGITLHEFFERGIEDRWPQRLSKAESIWLICGPPLLRQLEAIAAYLEDVEIEEAYS
jgi:hypothetical protein